MNIFIQNKYHSMKNIIWMSILSKILMYFRLGLRIYYEIWFMSLWSLRSSEEKNKMKSRDILAINTIQQMHSIL